MHSWSIDGYLDSLASLHPTPASSHVAALNLAQGAALLTMVARVRADKAGGDVVRTVPKHTSHVREAALRLAEADAAVVDEVADAFALPRTTGAEREHRAAAIADALLAAAGPPAELIAIGAELVGLCERLAEVASGALLGDVAAAADAAAAAISISRTNVEADLGSRRGDPEAEHLLAALTPVDDLLRRAAAVRDRIRRRLGEPRTQPGGSSVGS